MTWRYPAGRNNLLVACSGNGQCRECISVLSSFPCCLIFSHAPEADVAVAVFAVGIVGAKVRRRVGIVLNQPVDMVGLFLVETHKCLVGGRKPTLLSYGVVVAPRVLLRFFLQVPMQPYPRQAGTAEGTRTSCVESLVSRTSTLTSCSCSQTFRLPGTMLL